jgi:hypothetical protein
MLNFSRMRIYIGHSAGFDYQKELYEPLKASMLFTEHEIILPHDKDAAAQNPKDFYATIDLFIAEVSYPSTGLGIELAWTEAFGRKIICVHQAGKKPSLSLKSVCSDIRSYSTTEELIKIIQSAIAM